MPTVYLKHGTASVLLDNNEVAIDTACCCNGPAPDDFSDTPFCGSSSFPFGGSYAFQVWAILLSQPTNFCSTNDPTYNTTVSLSAPCCSIPATVPIINGVGNFTFTPTASGCVFQIRYTDVNTGLSVLGGNIIT